MNEQYNHLDNEFFVHHLQPRKDNQPSQCVLPSQVANMEVSIDPIRKNAHVFVGKTARAQLSIQFSPSVSLNDMIEFVTTHFPAAKVNIQK